MITSLLATLALALAGVNVYPMTLHRLEWGSDPEGFFQGTAFNFLAPKGWKPFAITGWNLVDSKNVNLLAGAESPDERFGYAFCPGLYQIFGGLTPGGGMRGFQTGTPLPPRLSDYMANLTGLPKREGFHVDTRDNAPAPSGMQGFGTACTMRFTYTRGGQPMEGVLAGRLQGSVAGNPDAPSGNYSGSWGIDSFFCVTFPKGEERKGMRFFSLAVPTYTPTLAFVRAVAVHDGVLKAMYTGIDKEAVDRSQIMAQVNAEREDALMDRYRAGRAAGDQARSAFCDMIGDIDRYRTADGTELQLSSGYKDAWKDREGNVILSDNIGYDPNQGTGGWTRLKKG